MKDMRCIMGNWTLWSICAVALNIEWLERVICRQMTDRCYFQYAEYSFPRAAC